MTEIPKPIKSLGAYRKDVYTLFEDIVGRKMSDEEHARIKVILTDYLAEHRVIIDTSKPIEHIFTCAKCRNVESRTGHSAAKRHLRHVIKEDMKES